MLFNENSSHEMKISRAGKVKRSFSHLDLVLIDYNRGLSRAGQAHTDSHLWLQDDLSSSGIETKPEG